ncbi:predicted protein [Histoplasma capsulatum H143]|uniref:Uncharacterized protein n=1 Tax=Ajellomyces capsulatus (strain H143) TaxID=544712 RepID=C6HSZ1_AJECH|nr:predicted protein [Histoplasma capsulatum H143]
METIPESPTKDDAAVQATNGIEATNITTSKITFPLKNAFSKPKQPTFSTTGFRSRFKALLTTIDTLIFMIHTFLHKHHADLLSAYLKALIENFAYFFSIHPHLTTLVTCLLLCTCLPVLIFLVFALSTMLFFAFLALLGATALSMLVIAGALVMLCPVLFVGIVVAGMLWSGCWMVWYAVLCAALLFKWLRESSLETNDNGRENRVGLAK